MFFDYLHTLLLFAILIGVAAIIAILSQSDGKEIGAETAKLKSARAPLETAVNKENQNAK